MIPNPADLSIGQRIVLTIIIVLVILFAFALAGWMTGGWDQAPAAPSAFESSPFDQRLAELEHTALDDAYMQRVHLLFRNWLDDGHGQPDRMLVGMSKARKAYTEALTEVIRREKR